MSNTGLLVGAVLVAAVVGGVIGWMIGSAGTDPVADLNLEPVAGTECVKISVDRGSDSTFAIVDDETGEWRYVSAKDGEVEVCGSFRIYKVDSAGKCSGGSCDSFEEHPVTWPPSG